VLHDRNDVTTSDTRKARTHGISFAGTWVCLARRRPSGPCCSLVVAGWPDISSTGNRASVPGAPGRGGQNGPVAVSRWRRSQSGDIQLRISPLSAQSTPAWPTRKPSERRSAGESCKRSCSREGQTVHPRRLFWHRSNPRPYEARPCQQNAGKFAGATRAAVWRIARAGSENGYEGLVKEGLDRPTTGSTTQAALGSTKTTGTVESDEGQVKNREASICCIRTSSRGHRAVFGLRAGPRPRPITSRPGRY